MPKYRLILSAEADKDLDALYEYGCRKWGEERADRYYDDLVGHFDILCDNPYLFMAVDEVCKGYRRSVCGKHSIYYRVNNDAVEIMALVKHENRP